MDPRIITVFGATGVPWPAHRSPGACNRGCRADCVEAPRSGSGAVGADDPRLQAIGAAIRETQSVADAMAGVHGVVNAVSLYTERGTETFHVVHVECAGRVAIEAHRAGIEHLVHLSGIGADPASGSSHVRSRGQGELPTGRPIPVRS